MTCGTPAAMAVAAVPMPPWCSTAPARGNAAGNDRRGTQRAAGGSRSGSIARSGATTSAGRSTRAAASIAIS